MPQMIYSRLIFLCLCLVSLSGCVVVAAGAGAGTVAYAKGKLEVVEHADYQRVWQASLEGTRQAGLSVINSNDYGSRGMIVARTADERKVTVKVDSIHPEKTALEIRVGTFGDQDLSLRIYNRIKAQL